VRAVAPSRLARILATALVAGAPGTASAEAAKRALLIGINDYAMPAVPDLRGAVSDVERVRRLLETRMGFPSSAITTLTDARATRAAILAAIDRLVAESQPDDVVYFHYSGHGSQVRDRDGDEADGLDETIVAHDSRQPGVPDITDDELDRRFDRLRTRRALLVFDSCHSGTVTRSIAAATPRAIPADERTDLYPPATRAVVAVDKLPHVLMTGAPADQQALDAPVGDGFVGLFTYALTRSLDQLGPGASPELVHATMRRELRSLAEKYLLRPPEPQLEAAPELLHEPLFAATGTPQAQAARRAWLETQPDGPDRVRLLGASALGAAPGSKWALYPPGELQFTYGAALAAGTVEGIAGPDAMLRVTERRAAVPAGARAIPLMSADASAQPAIRIEGVARERAAVIAAALTQQLGVQLAAPGAPYRFLLELRERAWRVQDAAGLRQFAAFLDGADEAVAASLAAALRPLIEASGLLSLDNLAADLKLWVGVQSATSRPPATRSIVLVSDDPRPAYRARRPGEPRGSHNSLVLELQSDRDAYITVVDVDPEGRINLLFPNDAQKPGFLPGGRVPGNTLVRIPDSLVPDNAAGFYFDYSPPAGRDTVRVFAASDLPTANSIRRYVQAAASSMGSTAGLGAELAAGTVRGIKLSTESAPALQGGPVLGEWTAASVVVEIGE
jgi:hypothetical protein